MQMLNYSWLLHHTSLSNLQNKCREKGFKNTENLNSAYQCALPIWYS